MPADAGRWQIAPIQTSFCLPGATGIVQRLMGSGQPRQ
jgi:hypothetical protein